jgi:uracil-DNA glycosylase
VTRQDLEQRWAAVRDEARDCPRCDLALGRTQVVFGEGALPARIMLVGQGPGEVEDEQGHPFVGPSGRLLDEALAEAGLRREDLYITNIVRCFPYKLVRGRKVNRAPLAGERKACAPWMEAELALAAPRIVVAVGGPAAQALIDRKFKITQQRGTWHDGPNGTRATATYHPSYLLRLRGADPAAFERAWAAWLEDWRAVAAEAAADL